MTGCDIQIADRGADRPGLQCWIGHPQPTQGQFRLCAPFAADQLMPLIQDHRVELGKQPLGMATSQQHAQRFGCGDQDLRRCLDLFVAITGGGVTVADAHPQWPAHGLNRLLQGER